MFLDALVLRGSTITILPFSTTPNSITLASILHTVHLYSRTQTAPIVDLGAANRGHLRSARTREFFTMHQPQTIQGRILDGVCCGLGLGHFAQGPTAGGAGSRTFPNAPATAPSAPHHRQDSSFTSDLTNTPLPDPTSMPGKCKLERMFRNFMHSIRHGQSAGPASTAATSPTLVPSTFDTTAKLDTKPRNTCQKRCHHAFRKALRMLGLKNSKAKHVATPPKAAPSGKPAQPTLSARIAAWSGEAKFGPVLKIPDCAVIELALDLASRSSAIPKNILADGSDIKVIAKTRGQNNRVFIVQYQEDLKICVRVPACAWEGAWTDKDAEALRTQVRTMQYIKRHTKCPIPEIVTYDTTFNNAINAPHVVMTYVEGRPVEDLWYEKDGSLSLEAKRQNILRSLASGVAQLRSLTFDKMGALRFTSDEDNSPTPGPSHLLNFGVSRTPSFMEYVDEVDKENEPQPNSEVYFRKVLEEWKEGETSPSEDDPHSGGLELYEDLGTYRLFSMLLDELPFTKSEEPEVFVLAPPDFDDQNILADEHGNVTAILDWDRIETCTRFVGWCRFPEFLHVDWDEEGDYFWPHWGQVMSPVQFDKYRADYTRYMTEACDGGEDCKYTAKSHLYEKVLAAIGRKTAMESILDFLMPMVIPRAHVKPMRKHIGEKGLEPEEEEVIRQGFRKLLQCQSIPGK